MSNPAADGAYASSALLAPSTAALPEDQDAGDLPPGVDEDALNNDQLDTDQIVSLD